MSPNEQRIAIAETCGWIPYSMANSQIPYWRPHGEPWSHQMHQLPDYLHDLNAMHEAEQILWDIEWNHRYTFNDRLADIIRGRAVNRNEWTAETLLDATAGQRAEAFLKTLNLWTSET
jgi:hypothetical protein